MEPYVESLPIFQILSYKLEIATKENIDKYFAGLAKLLLLMYADFGNKQAENRLIDEIINYFVDHKMVLKDIAAQADDSFFQLSSSSTKRMLTVNNQEDRRQMQIKPQQQQRMTRNNIDLLPPPPKKRKSTKKQQNIGDTTTDCVVVKTEPDVPIDTNNKRSTLTIVPVVKKMSLFKEVIDAFEDTGLNYKKKKLWLYRGNFNFVDVLLTSSNSVFELELTKRIINRLSVMYDVYGGPVTFPDIYRLLDILKKYIYEKHL